MIEQITLALPHGVTLAARRNAVPGRPRVLFLHGFPEAAFVWDELSASLAPEVACLAPQLRGYAGSSTPAEVADYRARHLVADVAAVIEQQGAPIELVVAHDWGGALAWPLAAQRPQLLRRLLILNSPHPATFLRELRDDAAQQAASAYMTFLCRPDAAQRLAEDDFRRLWRFFADGAGTMPAWLDDATRDRYRATWRAGLDGALNYYRASPLRPPAGADDPLHRLVLDDAQVTVRVPTHVLWGEQDSALRPGLLDGLARWVPELVVERLPDASHWLVHEQPQRVRATVLRLLDGAP